MTDVGTVPHSTHSSALESLNSRIGKWVSGDAANSNVGTDRRSGTPLTTTHTRSKQPVAPPAVVKSINKPANQGSARNQRAPPPPNTHLPKRMEERKTISDGASFQQTIEKGEQSQLLLRSSPLVLPTPATPESTPAIPSRKGADKGTNGKVPVSEPTSDGRVQKAEVNVKASILDTLNQLDPQALLLIQKMVKELNLVKETDKAASEPPTLTPYQLDQLKMQLNKLVATNDTSKSDGQPPPYSANHNTKPPVNNGIEDEILRRISSRLSIISEMTEPDEVSELDMTNNNTVNSGSSGDVVLSEPDDTLDGSDCDFCSTGSSNGIAEESSAILHNSLNDSTSVLSNLVTTLAAPPHVRPSPSPPLPPQAFRNIYPQTTTAQIVNIKPVLKSTHANVSKIEIGKSRSAFKAAKNKNTTQRAFGMNFSDNFKIEKGESGKEEAAASELAISLYVDEADDGFNSDEDSELSMIDKCAAEQTPTFLESTQKIQPYLESTQKIQPYLATAQKPSVSAVLSQHSSSPAHSSQTGSQVNQIIHRVPPVGADFGKQPDLQRNPADRVSPSTCDKNTARLTTKSLQCLASSALLTNSTPVSSFTSSFNSLNSNSVISGDRPSYNQICFTDNRRPDSGASGQSNSNHSTRPTCSSPFLYGKTNRSISPASSGSSSATKEKTGKMGKSALSGSQKRIHDIQHDFIRNGSGGKTVVPTKKFASPRLTRRSSNDSLQKESETVFPSSNTFQQTVPSQISKEPVSALRGFDERPLSYTAHSSIPNTIPGSIKSNRKTHCSGDQLFENSNRRNQAEDRGRLYHSLDKRKMTSEPISTQYKKPPAIPPRAPISPTKSLYENVSRFKSIRTPEMQSRDSLAFQHSPSNSSVVDNASTCITEPDFIRNEACPGSPLPLAVHNWLRETIGHATLDSESNTTSVEDNVISDGRCENVPDANTDHCTESKPTNDKVKGRHFDIEAAVAKLKIKKDPKIIEQHGLTKAQNNNSHSNYYIPNMDTTGLKLLNRKVSDPVHPVPRRYVPKSSSEPPQQLMNNPMQFIDVAHEKSVLMDMYSDQISLLESNMSDLVQAEANDPANLHRQILKHLVKVQNESSGMILPNMKSQKLNEVQPDLGTGPYFKNKPSPVSPPDNFRCIGKIIYSTTGRVKVMELYRPPDGYFGFQISPTIQDNKLRVFISGFGHGLTDKLFTGLLAVGDEVLNVNGNSVCSKTFTEVISILSMSQALLLTVKSNDPKFSSLADQPDYCLADKR